MSCNLFVLASSVCHQLSSNINFVCSPNWTSTIQQYCQWLGAPCQKYHKWFKHWSSVLGIKTTKYSGIQLKILYIKHGQKLRQFFCLSRNWQIWGMNWHWVCDALVTCSSSIVNSTFSSWVPAKTKAVKIYSLDFKCHFGFQMVQHYLLMFHLDFDNPTWRSDGFLYWLLAEGDRSLCVDFQQPGVKHYLAKIWWEAKLICWTL